MLENIALKFYIYKKEKEISKLQFEIDKNLWVFQERMDVKDNGETGMLSINTCSGESFPMRNRNGTKDLNVMSLYKLTDKRSPKKVIGNSIHCFSELQESLNEATRILKRFKKIKTV